MPQSSKRIQLKDSDKKSLPNAHVINPVEDDERFEVTVRVRADTSLGALDSHSTMEDKLPAQRTYMSREDYIAKHGASADDMTKVEEFAKSYGLVVVEASAARRSIFLSGTAAQFSAAFGATLHNVEHPGGTYRGRTGSLSIPAELENIIEGVFGLDNRPQAKPHFQALKDNGIQAHAASGSGSFTPPDLAKVYNFPTGLDGSGQCIAIIELGGGLRTADIKSYFTSLKLPVPNVKVINVDGGKNQPSTADSADGEVMLDIEVAAAVAPKATIAVYFAPNTNKGFLDAITKAIHDTVNKPSVISISWGGPEVSWTAQAMKQFDQAFQAAAAIGITVCCASGDAGSADGETDGKAHVDFPASSPFALGCGGTKLTASNGKISKEVVWNESTDSASGGGVSNFFPVPSYQSKASVPLSASSKKAGRGVPDVGGDADPQSGYKVRVDGQNMVIGGTSAVAPLWAGLVALMNQKIGHPVGFLNPLIYGSLANTGLFHDVSTGNNGAYHAKAGWDPCTGWGSPIGSKLLQALMG
ncbi:MAG TPA: S53 family peptidase [Rhodocyclaceae bacterium]|nr:S53 family peptidase [Rhodocyclaceae bacterium]